MHGRLQEESLLSIWTNAQERVLASWLDLVEESERVSRSAAWNETVSAWQTAVQETLDAQFRWLQDWSRRVQVTAGSPTDLRKNMQEAQVLLLGWTEAQQHLWRGWFQIVQQLGSLLENGAQADTSLLSRLRECGQEVARAQEEWVQRWTENLLDHAS